MRWSGLFITFLLVLNAAAAEVPTSTSPPSTSPAGSTALAAVDEPIRKPLDIAAAQDFRPLFEERDLLSTQIAALDVKIRDLSEVFTNLPSEASLKANIAKAEENIKKATRLKDQAQQDLSNDYLAGAQADLKTIDTAREKLEEHRATREARVHRLFLVEQKIASRRSRSSGPAARRKTAPLPRHR